jgi:signal transduction histidine kinase
MNNDRFGAIILAAGVLVAGLIIALLYWHQVKVQRETIRIHGVALVRALSLVEMSKLAPETGSSSLLAALTGIERSDAFAYGVVVTKSGEKRFEVASPGVIVPAATMPTEPASWFGEHLLKSPGEGREIREFYGPVLNHGELKGFVRIGYYANPRFLPFDNISYIAVMALPIFLLTALSIFMIRRETQPLSRLNQRMDEMAEAYGAGEAGLGARLDYRDLAQRFDKFMQLVQSRAREMDKQYLSAQTSSRLLAYKQERANAVLDALPEAVLVLDGSAEPNYANPKIEPLLGVSRDEVIGAPPQKWCRDKEVLELLTRLAQQTGPIVDANIVEYSPQEHPDRRISVSAYPLFSPRDHTVLLGRLIVFREISDEYRVRQAGTEFVAQVSHELKTPLANIAGYSELLLDHARIEEHERVNAVNVIHDETERAAALIDNLLHISKLESGTLPIHRQRVRLPDLLRDTADSMSKNAATKGVSLELKLAPDLGSARLDKNLFRIALDNLVSNAIKYSNAGGKVFLSAENLDDLQTKISVRDEGIGISAEDRARVFDKYYRSHAREVGARGGHGLGLFLAKQIVELHQGTISVSSEPGKGSEFTIVFHPQTQQLED